MNNRSDIPLPYLDTASGEKRKQPYCAQNRLVQKNGSQSVCGEICAPAVVSRSLTWVFDKKDSFSRFMGFQIKRIESEYERWSHYCAAWTYRKRSLKSGLTFPSIFLSPTFLYQSERKGPQRQKELFPDVICAARGKLELFWFRSPFFVWTRKAKKYLHWRTWTVGTTVQSQLLCWANKDRKACCFPCHPQERPPGQLCDTWKQCLPFVADLTPRFMFVIILLPSLKNGWSHRTAAPFNAFLKWRLSVNLGAQVWRESSAWLCCREKHSGCIIKPVISLLYTIGYFPKVSRNFSLF